MTIVSLKSNTKNIEKNKPQKSVLDIVLFSTPRLFEIKPSSYSTCFVLIPYYIFMCLYSVPVIHEYII